MIQIGKGPQLQKFADCFGMSIEEVLAWVNSYVNNPTDCLAIGGLYEATERERLASIKDYIGFRLANSVTGRVKQKIAEEKNAVEQVSNLREVKGAQQATKQPLLEAAAHA
jgi:hypothetical protein